jgi:hypothetical protein
MTAAACRANAMRFSADHFRREIAEAFEEAVELNGRT